MRDRGRPPIHGEAVHRVELTGPCMLAGSLLRPSADTARPHTCRHAVRTPGGVVNNVKLCRWRTVASLRFKKFMHVLQSTAPLE